MDQKADHSNLHSLQKSSANPLSLSIYKLTGSRSLENQPITANLSKIALYWHSWFNLNSYILANEIAWLQIIGKWHTDLSGYTRGLLQVCKTLVSIPLLSCSAVQCYFSRSTERKFLSHAQEWKLNRVFSSGNLDIVQTATHCKLIVCLDSNSSWEDYREARKWNRWLWKRGVQLQPNGPDFQISNFLLPLWWNSDISVTTLSGVHGLLVILYRPTLVVYGTRSAMWYNK